MNKPKITFDPKAFENFTGSQEELDQLVAEVTAYFQSDEFLDQIENPEDIEEFKVDEIQPNRKLH